ncbi:MAG: heavy-metal-associated domain-containing protein [Acidimicrobiaceae bacterium]|nr:heavy-metal-associated domain-containing protein [Acidimicrobiaceae bacterium]
MDTSSRRATLAVAGMTCTHCEHHVAEALTNAGVTEALADHHRGTAQFVWPLSATEEDLRTAVTEAGYVPGTITIE